MPKHKRLPLRLPPAGGDKRNITVQHPTTVSTVTTQKRSVARAHQKHVVQRESTLASKPTLADRFHALPTELRAQIFSILLVTPSKWDALHQHSCPLRASPPSIVPTIDSSPDFCVWCKSGGGWTWSGDHRWTLNHPSTWLSPWRSKWSEEIRNPWLCSECWVEKGWGHGPGVNGNLPCLCARRQNLKVLLACRRWYDEAGGVFYRGNTFCFEDCGVFTRFWESLDGRWKGCVTRVSILDAQGPDEDDVRPNDYRRHAEVLGSLRQSLCNLTEIELDARILGDMKMVRMLLRCGLRNKPCIRFMLKGFEDPNRSRIGNDLVWPSLAKRVLLRGGLPEEVARAMRGEKRAWMKAGGRKSRFQALETAVDEFRNWLTCIDATKTLEGIKIGKDGRHWYDCSDETTWLRWWRAIGWHHAWLPAGSDDPGVEIEMSVLEIFGEMVGEEFVKGVRREVETTGIYPGWEGLDAASGIS
ncbi:hypothetical protein LTR27_002645 [Elasticomyces elasticus]|nr:hypothetical protein LTR27_002645 [Elasticomyces elasticus]